MDETKLLIKFSRKENSEARCFRMKVRYAAASIRKGIKMAFFNSGITVLQTSFKDNTIYMNAVYYQN